VPDKIQLQQIHISSHPIKFNNFSHLAENPESHCKSIQNDHFITLQTKQGILVAVVCYILAL